jgi:hypothetical protein
VDEKKREGAYDGSIMHAVLPLIVTNALNALGAIVILLIGLWLSGRADLLVVRILRIR